MLTVSLVQLASPDDEGVEDRRTRAASMVRSARGAGLIVLPELWAAGYFAFDLYPERSESVNGRTVSDAAEWARDLNCFVHAGSYVERGQNGELYNTTALLDPSGRVVHSYRKIHVFGYKSREAELLTPGESVSATPTPFGRVASTTCYDLRFPEIWRALVDVRTDIGITPAAWPAARLAHWRLFTSARAVENQIVLAAYNAVGEQAGVTLGGHSRIVDPWGDVLVEAGDDEGVFTADVDTDIVGRVREEFRVLGDRTAVSRGAEAESLDAADLAR